MNETEVKKDLSNLFAATMFLNDVKRQEAFGSLYSVIRVVDDLSDYLLESQHLTEDDQSAARLRIKQWKKRVQYCYHQVNDSSRIDLSLLKAISLFRIPEFLWVDFFNALETSLSADGFQTENQFKKYCKGAAIVPITVFLLIVTAEKDPRGYYVHSDPAYLMELGEAMGEWSFVLHSLIMEKTYLLRSPSRNLIPLDLMKRHNVDLPHLRELAVSNTLDPQARTMLTEFVQSAERKKNAGLLIVRELLKILPPDRRKSLALLFGIYDEIHTRILDRDCNIFSEDPIWTPEDREAIIRKVDHYDEAFDLSVLW